jgi:pilus assembly protein Flp/PilA
MNIVKSFAKNESGATAIEYGLIAVGIAIAIITMVKGVGTSLNNAFSKVNSNLQ